MAPWTLNPGALSLFTKFSLFKISLQYSNVLCVYLKDVKQQLGWKLSRPSCLFPAQSSAISVPPFLDQMPRYQSLRRLALFAFLGPAVSAGLLTRPLREISVKIKRHFPPVSPVASFAGGLVWKYDFFFSSALGFLHVCARAWAQLLAHHRFILENGPIIVIAVKLLLQKTTIFDPLHG